jgi:hypothetical protein
MALSLAAADLNLADTETLTKRDIAQLWDMQGAEW